MSGPATRMELLRVKARFKLAKKGHSLLMRKRDALIRSFFDIGREYRKLREGAREKLLSGYEKVHLAQAVSGVNRLKGLAYAAEHCVTFASGEKNIMGVRVKTLDVTEKESSFNASLIGTSHYVQEARDQFCELIKVLAKLSELEQSLRALADEIVRTKRRVNALEHIQIPALEFEKKRIAAALDEAEREGFVRLKHVKKQLESHDS